MLARRAAVATAVTAAILLTGAASSALEAPGMGSPSEPATAAPGTPPHRTSPHGTPPHGNSDHGDSNKGDSNKGDSGKGDSNNGDFRGGDEADGPHTVRIHVSGPDDTLMRVVRDRRGSDVALRGEPFDHSFTEPAGSDGYLGITVLAASKQAGRPAVTCSITINGVVVSEQRALKADGSGLAQVLCTVPRDV